MDFSRLLLSALGSWLRSLGIDRDRLTRSADRHVKLLAVYELRRESGVDIDDDLVNCRALGRVRGRGVAMIDVAKTLERDGHLLAVIESHHRTLGIDGLDCGKFAIGNAECPVGCAELDAVASCENPLLFSKDFDTEEPDRIVLDTPPVRRSHRQQVGLAIDSLNSSVIAFGNRELFASASEANHVAFFIIVGHRALGA